MIARWIVAVAVSVSVMGLAAVARGGDAHAQRALAALASDGSIKVRAKAVAVLGQRGSREALPALCRALLHDPAPVVRVAAASSLGRLREPEALEALRRAARSDGDGAVRDLAARAEQEVRRSGARSIALEEVRGRAGDTQAREALRAALAAHLARQGFVVLESDEHAGLRLKPSVLSLDVRRSGEQLRVEVKVSVIAIDGAGRIVAMVEGGARARARAPGAASSQIAAQVASQALQAAAQSVAEDLGRRLLERS